MLIRLVLGIDDKAMRKELARSLGKKDVSLEVCDEEGGYWRQAIRSCGDVVVLNDGLIPLPIDQSMSILKEMPEAPALVVLYDATDPEAQARWFAAGADLTLSTQLPARDISAAIYSVVESRRQVFDSGAQAKSRLVGMASLEDFISESKSMYDLMREVHQVVRSNVPVLIQGETGVGKEHLAKAIHIDSPRSGGPFVTINTAAIPEQLLESELFGHTQGAFTGATRSRRGAFEQAHRGTIFLDEIGDMPVHLQTKLLRTLQDYEVRPLGSERSTSVDVRVVAATNQDLEVAIEAGTFRKDLFYRLSVIPLTIPPLRQRQEDIPSIVRRFFELRKLREGGEIPDVPDEVMTALCGYEWPGNIRELFNVLERATILSGYAGLISMENLPQNFRTTDLEQTVGLLHDVEVSLDRGETLQEALGKVQEVVERSYLDGTLRRTRGRVGQAARIAGINPRSMYAKMKKYGLEKEAYKK
jgi:transcriptional regulator with PAS, ATPase and Fis domain